MLENSTGSRLDPDPIVRRAWLLAAVAFLIGAFFALPLIRTAQVSADYTFETWHPYLQSSYGNKAYRGTRVTIGNWYQTGGLKSLPVTR